MIGRHAHSGLQNQRQRPRRTVASKEIPVRRHHFTHLTDYFELASIHNDFP
jgi:hypothetical protein